MSQAQTGTWMRADIETQQSLRRCRLTSFINTQPHVENTENHLYRGVKRALSPERQNGAHLLTWSLHDPRCALFAGMPICRDS
ncbi:hypothetical protein GDO81_026088 [Engystomops pustulosus]|uniref:Uncharacterized protein n=1 Tax=Engystomops pustulosus TaxID=76066 RepID=A0AAV6ZA41_ENGPU|nr:hypothetical protein GDO81_026088 [Engystomops pustulosus]